MDPKALLPLDAGRRISFTDRGKTYTYIFDRITPADWRSCFAAFVIDSEIKKRDKGEVERVETLDFSSPLVALVKRCVKAVEGYTLTDGRSLMEIPTWRERLQLGHVNLVGLMLQNVSEAEDEGSGIDPDFDIVRLEAFWTSTVAGEMSKYSPLTHFFKPMSVEQQNRVMRHRSCTTVVGGSRTGRTIYPIQHGLYLEMYDELIARVEGYSVGGTEIQTAEQARAEMDSWHKIAALTVLTKSPEETKAA